MVDVPRALLGVDLGQTRIKAVVFDPDGRPLGQAAHASEAEHPRARWAERDLASLWSVVALVICRAVERAGPGVEVVGVGVSGHSDGLYVVDEAGAPLRPAILATDGRAARGASRLAAGPRGRRLLELSGQLPMAASPVSLLTWLQCHEPDVLERARWVLSSTDWLRLMLTGTVSTDHTMAATGLLDLATLTWSEEALALCDLSSLAALLPPVRGSDEVVGEVTEEAAGLTGLGPGTPVVAGAHDVDTGALGLAALTSATSALLGTYSINQVLSRDVVLDERWQVRPFLDREQWLHMSTSPAGAGCLDWAAGRIGPRTPDGQPDTSAAVAEACATASASDPPYFLPFVHGGPLLSAPGGSWVGLRGDHSRADMLRAVMEGVAFNHRWHLDALRSRMSVTGPIRVGGGGARSLEWTQLLCDTWGEPIEITTSEEASALGGALLAGVGVGLYPDLAAAAEPTVRVARTHEPDPAAQRRQDARYEGYLALVDALASTWPGPEQD